jgi:hypothetical protein
MTKTLTATLFVLLAVPTFARADAQIAEWFGEYAMNHDGFQGTLRIQDSTRDCAAPAWCHLLASYVDKDGVRRLVTIRMMDQAWQHMVFYIAFPGNQQRFDGYLMSWDKSRIAGTTVWEGRTFGFFAVKRASVAELPGRLSSPTALGTAAARQRQARRGSLRTARSKPYCLTERDGFRSLDSVARPRSFPMEP